MDNIWRMCGMFCSETEAWVMGIRPLSLCQTNFNILIILISIDVFYVGVGLCWSMTLMKFMLLVNEKGKNASTTFHWSVNCLPQLPSRLFQLVFHRSVVTAAGTGRYHTVFVWLLKCTAPELKKKLSVAGLTQSGIHCNSSITVIIQRPWHILSIAI